MRLPRIMYEEIVELNRNRVLALMDPKTWIAANLPGQSLRACVKVKVEVMVEKEWVPVGRLLTWGEFTKTVALRLTATEDGSEP